MGKSFTERMVRCQAGTEMTVSDLMRWFERPRSTVNTWLGGRTPFGPSAPRAETRLAELEWSISSRAKYWPVPAELTWKDRQKYVQGMRDDAGRNYRIPRVRAAG